MLRHALKIRSRAAADAMAAAVGGVVEEGLGDGKGPYFQIAKGARVDTRGGSLVLTDYGKFKQEGFSR